MASFAFGLGATQGVLGILLFEWQARIWFPPGLLIIAGYHFSTRCLRDGPCFFCFVLTCCFIKSIQSVHVCNMFQCVVTTNLFDLLTRDRTYWKKMEEVERKNEKEMNLCPWRFILPRSRPRNMMNWSPSPHSPCVLESQGEDAAYILIHVPWGTWYL